MLFNRIHKAADSDFGASDQAVERYRQALAQCREQAAKTPTEDCREQVADCCYRLSGALQEQAHHDPDEVERLLREALALYRELDVEGSANWQEKRADCCRSLGLTLWGRAHHDPNEVERLLREALALYQGLCDHWADAFFCSAALGQLLEGQNRHDEAKELYRQAEDMLDSGGEAMIPANSRIEQARFFLLRAAQQEQLQRYGAAGQSYRRALTLYNSLDAEEAASCPEEIAICCDRFGCLLFKLERCDEALHWRGQALELYSRLALEDPAYRNAAVCVCEELGVWQFAMDRYDEATKTLRGVLPLCRELATENPALYQPKVDEILHILERLSAT